MNIDIKKMDIKELKVLAYDLLALLEQTQANLRIVNKEIADKTVAVQSTEQEEKPPVDKK